jgi:hypothetical protein
MLFEDKPKDVENVTMTIDEILEKWQQCCKNFDIPRLIDILVMGLYKFIIFLTEQKQAKLGFHDLPIERIISDIEQACMDVSYSSE